MYQARPSFLFRVLGRCHPLVWVLAGNLAPEISFGQGAIVFMTHGGGVDAPVTDLCTGERIGGPAWAAQLYYGLPGASESSLIAFTNAPAHFGTGETAGYITVASGGGIRYVDPATVNPGFDTAFQIRVWSSVLGNSWETAYANWLSGAFGYGVGMGKSSVIVTRTSFAIIEPPQLLYGMQGFHVQTCPEPGVGWLAALGAVAICGRGWLARRHNR